MIKLCQLAQASNDIEKLKSLIEIDSKSWLKGADVMKNTAVIDDLMNQIRSKEICSSGINIKDRDGNTILIKAIYQLKRVLDPCMIPIISKRIMPIHFNAYRRHIIKKLFQNGIDVNSANNEGNTALLMVMDLLKDEDSFRYEDYKGFCLIIINDLLDNGAYSDMKNNDGVSAYDLAVDIDFKNGNTFMTDYLKSYITSGLSDDE